MKEQDDLGVDIAKKVYALFKQEVLATTIDDEEDFRVLVMSAVSLVSALMLEPVLRPLVPEAEDHMFTTFVEQVQRTMTKLRLYSAEVSGHEN